jgi:hypothetical protein
MDKVRLAILVSVPVIIGCSDTISEPRDARTPGRPKPRRGKPGGH